MQVSVGHVDKLTPGKRLCVVSGDSRIVVFNVDGDLFAMDASCSHRGGPLEEGVVREGVVTCPWHFQRYDVRTGERTDARFIHQAVYPVTVADGVVFVEVPDPEPAKSMREQLLEHARHWERDA